MHFVRHIYNRLDFYVSVDVSLCFHSCNYIYFWCSGTWQNMSDVYYIFIRKSHKDEYHVHFAVIYCVEIKHWLKWTSAGWVWSVLWKLNVFYFCHCWKHPASFILDLLYIVFLTLVYLLKYIFSRELIKVLKIHSDSFQQKKKCWDGC